MEAPIKQKFIIEVDGEGQIKAYNLDLKNNEKQTKKNTKANVGFSSSLGKVAVGFVSVGAAVKASKIAWQLGELGAKVQTVDKNFKNFAQQGGMDSIKMVQDLRKASGGMMDDMFLQQQAMKGMISGIKFDDMIVAMEYVRKYALSTGDDVNAKMQTVMTGLARGSALFMDDVGIQVVGSKDVVNDTINQMKEKMVQFADTADDTSVAIAGMKTEFTNLKQNIGEHLSPVLDDVVGHITDIIKKWNEFLGIGNRADVVAQSMSLEEQLKAEKQQLEYYTKAMVSAKKANDDLVLSYRAGEISLEKGKILIQQHITNHKGAKSAVEKHKRAIEELTEKIQEQENSNGNETTSSLTPEEVAKQKKLADKAYDAMVQERERIEMNNAIEIATMEQFAKNYTNVMKDVQIAKTSAFGFGETSLGTQSATFYETELEEAQTFIESYGSIMQMGMGAVGDIFNAIYSKRMEDVSLSSRNEIEAVKASTKSQKQKAKEISEIEKKAAAEQKKIRMAQWRSDIFMSRSNTALAVTKALPNYPLAIATQVIGDISTGIMLANKPRFYYGSKDSGGANYTTVGGNSQGDAIPALLRSGETVINPSDTKKLMQGGNTTQSSNVTISAPITIQGNADQSVLDALPSVIVDTIQEAQFNGLFSSVYV